MGALRDLVDALMAMDETGIALRQRFNDETASLLDERQLSAAEICLLLTMDRGLVGDYIEATDSSLPSGWRDCYDGWPWPSHEVFQPHPVPPGCVPKGLTTMYPHPRPLVYDCQPNDVSLPADGEIRIVGQGFVSDLVRVAFVGRGGVRVPARVTGFAGTFRCATVTVTASFPEMSAMYAIEVFNRAGDVEMQIPTGVGVFLLVRERDGR